MAWLHFCLFPKGGDPDGHDPAEWPVGLDTKHTLEDLCEKRLTYDEVKERAVDELRHGSTNDGLLLGFVMLAFENVGWNNEDMRQTFDAYFWYSG